VIVVVPLFYYIQLSIVVLSVVVFGLCGSKHDGRQQDRRTHIESNIDHVSVGICLSKWYGVNASITTSSFFTRVVGSNLPACSDETTHKYVSNDDSSYHHAFV